MAIDLILYRTLCDFCSGLMRMWRHDGQRFDFFECSGIRRGFNSLQTFHSQREFLEKTKIDQPRLDGPDPTRIPPILNPRNLLDILHLPHKVHLPFMVNPACQRLDPTRICTPFILALIIYPSGRRSSRTSQAGNVPVQRRGGSSVNATHVVCRVRSDGRVKMRRCGRPDEGLEVLFQALELDDFGSGVFGLLQLHCITQSGLRCDDEKNGMSPAYVRDRLAFRRRCLLPPSPIDRNYNIGRREAPESHLSQVICVHSGLDSAEDRKRRLRVYWSNVGTENSSARIYVVTKARSISKISRMLLGSSTESVRDLPILLSSDTRAWHLEQTIRTVIATDFDSHTTIASYRITFLTEEQRIKRMK